MLYSICPHCGTTLTADESTHIAYCECEKEYTQKAQALKEDFENRKGELTKQIKEIEESKRKNGRIPTIVISVFPLVLAVMATVILYKSEYTFTENIVFFTVITVTAIICSLVLSKAMYKLLFAPIDREYDEHINYINRIIQEFTEDYLQKEEQLKANYKAKIDMIKHNT